VRRCGGAAVRRCGEDKDVVHNLGVEKQLKKIAGTSVRTNARPAKDKQPALCSASPKLTYATFRQM